MLDVHGDLSAVEIAFFSPALCIAVFVVFRHGFKKNLGWIYLVTLSILRIVGGACTLYMEDTGKVSDGLLETAAITSAIGTAPLLLVTMGALERIHEGMEHKQASIMGFRILHLTSLAAFILAIIGGMGVSDSDPSKAKNGKTELEAAAVLFFCIYLGLVGYTIIAMRNTKWVLMSERKLLQACTFALPFLLVRVIYTVIVAFSDKGSIFYFEDVNIWVKAFMQFTMEAFVVSLFIFAGLMTPKVERKPELPRSNQNQTQQRSQQRSNQRSLGDYRPSRLIGNALRGDHS
ncbi:hypothetical protein LTR08_003296 [Meristemomyces frigidus]|nr:hypothetical protein LTR08_003296 [Meristemomyces frigidus]